MYYYAYRSTRTFAYTSRIYMLCTNCIGITNDAQAEAHKRAHKEERIGIGLCSDSVLR